MGRFAFAVGGYTVLCLIVILVIVLRGDGPHPRVVAIYPFSGDRYWSGGTVQITFSQAMDGSSVERGLQVTPGSQGQGAWYGNTLNLQPVGDWRPNVTYHVRLVGRVTDDEGRPLHTPVSFWFRVHHVGRLQYCSSHGVRNVCEHTNSTYHLLTHSSEPVLQYALSSDGTTLAYTRRDSSGLPHLFVIEVDGTGAKQLTSGTDFADSHPWFAYGDTSSISYYRQPVMRGGARQRLGKRQTWNINIDGTNNAYFG